MVSATDKPSTRISSIFSLGSTSSRRSGTSSDTSESLHPNKGSRDSTPAKLPQLSTDVRLSLSTPDLRNENSPAQTSASPGLTPTFRQTTPIEWGALLPHLDSLKQPPQRTGSPGSRSKSRPASIAGSRGGSRPASPTKPFRSLTPTHEARLSKRRSWLPGRSRPQSRDVGGGMPQAWVVLPGQEEKITYDVSPLADLGRESSFKTPIYNAKTNWSRAYRFQSYGTTPVTRSSTCTIDNIYQSPLLKSTRPLSPPQENCHPWLMEMCSESLHGHQNNLDWQLLRNECSMCR